MGLLDLAQQAINPFGSPSKGEWNLIEGSFTVSSTRQKMVFFIEKASGEPRSSRTAIETMSDSGGRRKAKYEYPYVDGQRTEDLGRKAEKFSINIKFFGENYQTRFDDFISTIVNTKERGTLTHPVRGNIPCAFFDYEFIHRHDEFNSVTIRATFEEDQTDVIAKLNSSAASPNSALRSALQRLSDAKNNIDSSILDIGNNILAGKAVIAGMRARLDSIVGNLSRLISQLASTFSSDSQLQTILAQADSVPGGITNATSGTAADGTVLPPVFQVGFTESDSATLATVQESFTTANVITPQQAVYQMNQVRAEVKTAIDEVETKFSVDGAEIVMEYRDLIVEFQNAVEASISSANSAVTVYTVPYDMSLRSVAFLNGLAVDRQNDIADLNPDIDSVNLVAKGSFIVVPAT